MVFLHLPTTISFLWCHHVIVIVYFWSKQLKGAVSNTDSGLSHFQPMVSFLCGHGKYQNQYLDENKRWITDPDPKAICTKDKLEILEYCRKVSQPFSSLLPPLPSLYLTKARDSFLTSISLCDVLWPHDSLLLLLSVSGMMSITFP